MQELYLGKTTSREGGEEEEKWWQLQRILFLSTNGYTDAKFKTFLINLLAFDKINPNPINQEVTHLVLMRLHLHLFFLYTRQTINFMFMLPLKSECL